MPVITIQLDRMRQAISHAFEQHNEEMQAHVDEVLKELMKPEHLQRIIKEQIAKDMVDMLQKSFESAVHQAVWEAMRSDELRFVLAQRVKNAFLKGLK